MSRAMNYLPCPLKKTLKKEETKQRYYKTSVNFNFFLREDIFNYILDKSGVEPDKFISRKKDMNWKDNQDDLRKIIEKRFETELSLKPQVEIEKTWMKYFDTSREKAFHRIIQNIIPRPRDIIKYIRVLLENTVNGKVTDKSYSYANTDYNNYIYQNMITETESSYPKINKILDNIKEKFNNIYDEMEGITFIKSLKDTLSDEEKSFDFIEMLIEQGYLKCSINNKLYDNIKKIRDCYKDNKKWFLLFKKHKIQFHFVQYNN